IPIVLAPMNKKKIGLVLSGGGVRGVAHLGVLSVLQRFEIEPCFISGTSAGAIVGALYAAGCSVGEMMTFWEQSLPFELNYFNYRKPGILDMDKTAVLLAEYLKVDEFAALKHRLFVTATDMIAGESTFFSEGPLLPAVAASAAFPIVFSPVEIDGKLYQDGGIMNNFPIEPLRERCDLIIGVNVSPLGQVQREDLDNSIGILERVYDLATDISVRAKQEECDILIAPEALADYPTFGSDKIAEIFKIGYDAALEQFELFVNRIETDSPLSV
ncbi:MAG: patatin-like phospholipase family protein, partial [Bacteroidota bacterium]